LHIFFIVSLQKLELLSLFGSFISVQQQLSSSLNFQQKKIEKKFSKALSFFPLFLFSAENLTKTLFRPSIPHSSASQSSAE
jgi:hypothetical protein